MEETNGSLVQRLRMLYDKQLMPVRSLTHRVTVAMSEARANVENGDGREEALLAVEDGLLKLQAAVETMVSTFRSIKSGA